MRSIFRFCRNFIILLGVVVFALWLVGPREPIDTTVTWNPNMIGQDVEEYLKSQESKFSDIVPGTQKRVVWAGNAGQQTDLAIVYLHGWGASSEEIRPVPDHIAEHFNANLFFTRLKGHGRPSAPYAMSEPTMNDWIQDFAEAMEIGRRIGKRVLIVSTSTGGSLAIAGAKLENYANNIAGLVLVSPNFGPRNPMARLANWPLARYWVPLLVGEWREWEPHNEQQARFWTTRTQNAAALPMMALIKHVGSLDLQTITIPALFIYSKEDAVVSPDLTGTAFADWGGPKHREIRVLSDPDTASHHVIAGDIMNPSQTDETIDIVTTWVLGLEK